MARTDTLPHFLTDVADAIREKKGTSETITASDFDTEIENLPSGGSGLDWSAIGYDEEPPVNIDAYNYAVQIKNNWTATTSYASKFNGDKKLVYMPLVDTSRATTTQYMFTGCYCLQYIPLLDTSNTIYMQQMFQSCFCLLFVPQFNTQKVKNFESIFYQCASLTDVPILNTSSASNMTNMFRECTSLTDTSLDNILQMCIGATSYTGTKTLARLGFASTNYPSSRIQALPHYQDFIDAGWTIGY